MINLNKVRKTIKVLFYNNSDQVIGSVLFDEGPEDVDQICKVCYPNIKYKKLYI